MQLHTITRFTILLLVVSLGSASVTAATIYTIGGTPGAPNEAYLQTWTVDLSSSTGWTNATSTTGTRTAGVGVSSGISLGAGPNPSFYGYDGSPTGSSIVQHIYVWATPADWLSNTNSNLVAATGAESRPSSGFAFYNNEYYVLSGNPDNTGTRSLLKYASNTDWINNNSTTLASFSLPAGLGFDIAQDGSVYFLASNANHSDTNATRTLYSWPNLTAFINGAGTASGFNHGSLTLSGSNIQGIAVVPEPSTLPLCAVIGLVGWTVAGRRKRKAA